MKKFTPGDQVWIHLYEGRNQYLVVPATVVEVFTYWKRSDLALDLCQSQALLGWGDNYIKVPTTKINSNGWNEYKIGSETDLEGTTFSTQYVRTDEPTGQELEEDEIFLTLEEALNFYGSSPTKARHLKRRLKAFRKRMTGHYYSSQYQKKLLTRSASRPVWSKVLKVMKPIYILNGR